MQILTVFAKVHISWEDHKFCEIFTISLTVCTVVKSKGKISQDFVAFSEYMNFNIRAKAFQIDPSKGQLILPTVPNLQSI